MSGAGTVQVLAKMFGKRMGYDVVVRDGGASVQDYLDALNGAIEELPLSRGRRKTAACRGCDLCCAERAPLTWVDVLNLEKHLKTGRLSLQQLLDRVGNILVDGPVVDITLRRNEDGSCIFLDRESRLCSVYPARPLVCQTFICCPASRRAARMRDLVVNSGEDELVRRWLLHSGKKGEEPAFHEGYRPRVRIEDWRPNAFTGKKHYRRVLLKELCPPDLWRQVFVPG